MRSFLCSIVLLFCAPLAIALELRAPAQANADSTLPIEVIGETDPRSFVTIVAPQAEEGSYDDYVYTRKAQLELRTPAQTGEFELRLLGPERPYPILARQPLRIVLAEAALDAPDAVAIGAPLTVRWRGPSGSNEYVTIVAASTPDGKYDDYKYVRGAGEGEVVLEAPTAPGAHEIRYMTGSRNLVLARRALQVGDVATQLSLPARVGTGESFEVSWTGPGNERDYLTIVAPDAADGHYDDYVYVKQSTLQLTAPETPGEYEVRYVVADGSRVLARAALSVGAADASLDAPAEVEAGSEFAVAWRGPDNDLDYIAVTQVGAPKEYIDYAYTKRGNPARLPAPRSAGDYELHYLTGRTSQSLARRALRVLPSAVPGTLRVIGSAAAQGSLDAGASTVELILDASGSMLQKLEGRRRIEIARDALEQLVQRQLAPGTPVALRVFGHRQPDACDTELLVPLAPLDRAALAARVRGIEAKNLARTPIADSLAAVAQDLAGVEGRAVVILMTDGEETCGGDPEAVVRELRASGFDVVLNIVGFAIDEYALEQDFRRWAAAGGGAYFSATDAAGLARSVSDASRLPFAVFSDGAQRAAGVIGGPALTLEPGRYEIRSGTRRWTADVRAGEETLLQAE